MNEREAYSTVIAQNELEDDKILVKAIFRRYPIVKLGELIDALHNAIPAVPEDKVPLTFLADTLQELLNDRLTRKRRKK